MLIHKADDLSQSNNDLSGENASLHNQVTQLQASDSASPSPTATPSPTSSATPYITPSPSSSASPANP
jgi:hypothetical protein